MREQEKRKITTQIKEIEPELLGESMYVRPFQKDEKKIAEIARASGEKKGVVAQRLIRLALRGKEFDFSGEKNELKKLDWLVENEKHKLLRADGLDARIERLEEYAQEMERLQDKQAENAHLTNILLNEIYGITNVCLSLLNQIFTKIIEYFSPVEIEKKNSVDFADRNILGLVEYALAELEKIGGHHEIELTIIDPEKLYLFTKIEKIKTKLRQSSPQLNSVNKNSINK